MRNQTNAADALPGTGNIRFAGNYSSVFQLRFERHVLSSGRENSSANREDLRRNLHGPGKIARDVRKRRQKKIAETVASQRAPHRKPVLKKLAEKMLVLRKRHHAIADIAGRQHAIFAAQTP